MLSFFGVIFIIPILCDFFSFINFSFCGLFFD